MTFREFFKTATGHAPYDYQRRLACGERNGRSEAEWLAGGADCSSHLISIPTGLGKTAAVVLAWLWNRLAPTLNPLPRQNEATAGQPSTANQTWPRRLVYCLPMRTLVEQTRDEVLVWLGRLALVAAPEDSDAWLRVRNALIQLPTPMQSMIADFRAAGAFAEDLASAQEDLVWLFEHSPIILMGGEEAGQDWDVWPEKPAILIGTQDMLLSRALNRGYGMSRYRWPMHFGLLNNDALWVLDETQLMGPGLSTACQLESFRASNASGYGSFGEAGSVTWYMSATSNRGHLNTREWRDVARPAEFDFSLGPEEKAATSGPIHQRRFAVKRLELKPDSGFESLIASILKRHEEMVEAIAKNPELPARTLIICNTVDRAVNVHALIAKEKLEGCDLLLLHSRFRPPERKEQMERFKSIIPSTSAKGQIVVATQVIEAGVDLSSAILCSEIAPLASLVQRFGRLNRSGEFRNSGWDPVAMIVGVGVEAAPPRETKDEVKKREDRNAGRCLPYELSACESAWGSLRKLNGNASPASFEQIQDGIAASIPRCPYSLQRHELTDFFDTDANLSLGFTDVSPFVRGLDDDTDLQVCWREGWSENDGSPEFVADYQRDELCSVPIVKALKARDVLNRGWLWRGKESGWISVRDAGIAPGMTILLPLSAGGYDNAAGWTGNKDDNKHSSHYQPKDESSDEERLSCLANGWRSIAAHTAEVASELTGLLGHLLAANENQQEHEALLNAVPWHDVGKNHPHWQQAVTDALANAGIAEKPEFHPFAKFSLSDSSSLRKADGSFRLSGKELKREINRLRGFFRPGIAHEVASALSFRQSEQVSIAARPLSSLLTEYVIMSHHGHVRKVLRDEIPRFPKDAKDNDTVRGVEKGSEVPAVVIGGKSLGCASLSTDCRRMGRDANGHESYTRGVLRLLDHYGPFRLAFLEALFRAADIRASILAAQGTLRDSNTHELDGHRPQMASPAAGAQATAPVGGYSGGCGAEYGFREGTSGGNDGSRATRPDRATRFIQTTRGVLSYTQLAPLLAERVARLETQIYSGVFASRRLDDADLLLNLHRGLCGDLVPEWAGRWRAIAVAVGRLSPPPPHQVPVLMREYGLDLQARWQTAAQSLSELTLELLAFAEGRFLTVHPFQDFNGRTIRVFLLELLRRLDLPRVELAPQTEPGRAEYFAALEAADHSNWQPLVAIWKARLANSRTMPSP